MLEMKMGNLTGPTDLVIEEKERIGKLDTDVLPRSLESVQEEATARISTMDEEAVNWSYRVSAVETLTHDYITSAPNGVRIGSGTQCSGVGVSASGGSTVYTQQTLGGARSPESHQQRYGEYPKVYKHTNTSVTTVGTVTTVGRMNGDFGYSEDGRLIVGALASFNHNWVGKLVAFFERGTTPFEGSWELPNLVLTETDEPEQFIPDASFNYNTRPAGYTSFSVVIQAPEETKVGFDIRDSEFNSVARVNSTTVPAGESRTIVRAGPFPPSQGVFNVVPQDAPQGLTVKSVKTSPMSF